MRPLGDDAVLLDVDGGHRAAQALARTIRAREVVPGAASVGVVGAYEQVTAVGLARPPVTHEIPLVLEGEDLAELGLDPRTVAAELAESELEVAWLGFMPGFAYLVGLPERLARIPRRATPRTRVPPGSFAVANGYAGIYPAVSPGGWNLLGRTGAVLFDPARLPYALLQPGDTVRLVPAGAGDVPVAVPPRRDPLAGRALEVLDAGPLLLVEDGGRSGCGHLGVPRAGAANQAWLRIANRAVGNDEWAGALELAGAARFRARRDLHVALAGECRLAVNGAELPPRLVVAVGAGQVIETGPVARHARALLAVAGGVLASSPGGSSFFGSSSCDAVSGLPPGPLLSGDVLDIGEGRGRPRLRFELPDPGGRGALRAMPGPDAAAETPELFAHPFVVDRRSDRTGLRLVRPEGCPPAATPLAPVASHAVVPGAVQLPPDGDPVVLGPDCGPVGGYPVVATVVTADLWRLGALVPGDAVSFEAVSQDEAEQARDAADREVAAAVSGWFPTSVA